MGNNYLKSALVVIFVSFASIMSSQTSIEKINELKIILKKSVYKSDVNINASGLVTRIDNNNNVFTFSLKDVQVIKSSIDGQYTVILLMKKGKTTKSTVNGKNREGSLNAFTFDNKEDFEKAMVLLNLIIG